MEQGRRDKAPVPAEVGVAAARVKEPLAVKNEARDRAVDEARVKVADRHRDKAADRISKSVVTG